MKVLITGGHYTPAIAVIEELIGNEIVFVGRKYSIESELTESQEYKEIMSRGLKFISLHTGKINRFFSLGSILNIFRIFTGLNQAKKIIKEEKPDIVLCFGSYLAVPIAIYAWLNKIPVFTHEQTIYPGLSNRFISLIAKKVFISFEKSRRFFPHHKVVLTGNPVRQSIIKTNIKLVSKKPAKKTIFITGGSLGSHSINIIILENLKKLLQKYNVIHQTGNVKEFDDYRKLLEFKKKLSIRLKSNYFVREHFNNSQIGEIYSKTDLLISRAGANTIFELIALEIPAVLIPLPWSANKEQIRQALFLKENGVCEVFYQNQKPQKFNTIIDRAIDNISKYKHNYKNVKYLYKKDAAKKIAKEIFKS